MKTSKELIEELEVLNQRADALEKETEGVDPTTEQRDEYTSLLADIKSKERDIQISKDCEERKKEEARKSANVAGVTGSTSDEKELDKARADFSFGRVIRAAYGIEKLDGLEAEMVQEGQNEARMIGLKGSAAGIMIPGKLINPEKRANITENTTTGIQETSFVDAVYAASPLGQLGITTINTNSDTRIPILGAVTVKWEGETDANADGGNATTKVDLAPKRISTYVNYSKQAALQHNSSLEAGLRGGIAQALGAKLSYATFTDDSSEGGFNHVGNGKTAVSSSTMAGVINGVIEQVMGNNHNYVNGKFVLAHDLYAELYTAVLATGVSALVQNNKINGFDFYFSTQVADTGSLDEGLYFGDWSKWWMAQFGGIEVLVDPYTQAASGMDRLVLNSFWDAALTQGAAISMGAFTGTNV